jgi:hypothetical protein
MVDRLPMANAHSFNFRGPLYLVSITFAAS